jgi:hypothetical protein
MLRKHLCVATLGVLLAGTSYVLAEPFSGSRKPQRLPPIIQKQAAEEPRQSTSQRRTARLPVIASATDELQINLPDTPHAPIVNRVGEMTEILEPPTHETLDQAWSHALAVDPWLDAKRLTVAAAESGQLAANAESYPWLDVGTSYTLRDNQPGFVFSAPPTVPNNTIFPNAQRASCHRCCGCQRQCRAARCSRRLSGIETAHSRRICRCLAGL